MSTCTRCGASFGCAVAGGGVPEDCWCMRLPRVVALPARGDAAAPGCWCPACLEQHIAHFGAAPSATLRISDAS